MDLEVFLQNADSNLINIYESLVQAFPNIEPGVILEILTYSSPEQVVEKLIILSENNDNNSDDTLTSDDDEYPDPFGGTRYYVNTENTNITDKILSTINNVKNGLSNLIFRNQSNIDDVQDLELSGYQI